MGEVIKWGLKRGFLSGNSKLYSRKCFGYKHNEYGELIIDEGQAEVVRTIFDLYLSGLSVLLIIRELVKRKMKSPQGNDRWSKHAIQRILTNEKYIGRVLLGKTCTGDFPNNKQQKNDGGQDQFLMKNAHEPILAKSNKNYSSLLMEKYTEIRSPYVQSLVCLILGFRGEEKIIPWMVDRFYEMKKLYPDESYDQGPLLALHELNSRLYGK